MLELSKKIKYHYDGLILPHTTKFNTWSFINYAMKMKIDHECIEIHGNSP
jgi:phage pi2 protein 07